MRLKRVHSRRIAVLMVTVGAAAFAATSSARQRQQPRAPQIVVTDYDMRKAAESLSGSTAGLAGKKIFIQRCALCHDLLGQPAVTTVGPWVDAETVKARGESAVRQTINNGSRRMPGWRYTLTPPQVDQVIAYLNTVTPDQKPKPPGQVVMPTD